MLLNIAMLAEDISGVQNTLLLFPFGFHLICPSCRCSQFHLAVSQYLIVENSRTWNWTKCILLDRIHICDLFLSSEVVDKKIEEFFLCFEEKLKNMTEESFKTQVIAITSSFITFLEIFSNKCLINSFGCPPKQ